VTVTDAGPDDSYDPTGRADPEQVARRLYELRRERWATLPRWEHLSGGERAAHVGVMLALLEWLRREGTRP